MSQPNGSLEPRVPTTALEQVLDHAHACLIDFKSLVTGDVHERPDFCGSIEVSGLDGLQGSVTITLNLSATRTLIETRHHEE